MKAEVPFPEALSVKVRIGPDTVSTAVYEARGPEDIPPLLLLHGLGAWSYTWRHLLAATAGHRRTVALDLLGHGSTDALRGGDYSPRGLFRHVLATLEALDIERAVWAGNSLGGGLGLLAAIERPETVAGLVLLAPAGYPQELPRNLALMQWPGAPWLFQFFPARLIVREMLLRVFHEPEKLPPDLIDHYTAPLADRRRIRAMLQAAASIWPEDLEEIAARVPEIEAPTLLIWGEEDRITPPELAHRYRREMARSRLVMLPSSGHAPQEERPAEVASEVRSFLESLPP
jgi:pimeloyl-ACP methyl ester carboxylesterase